MVVPLVRAGHGDLSGSLITGQEDYWANDFFKRANGLSISTGMLLGIMMFLNVWGVIWRKQKVVLANAADVLAGRDADPGGRRRGTRGAPGLTSELHLLGVDAVVHGRHLRTST